jgi:hypothetical protein
VAHILDLGWVQGLCHLYGALASRPSEALYRGEAPAEPLRREIIELQSGVYDDGDDHKSGGKLSNHLLRGKRL